MTDDEGARQFAWGKAGDVVLLVHATESPSDARWDAYLAFVKSVRIPPERIRTLVFSDGGRPTMPQRSRLAELVRGRPSRVAIVTDAAGIAFISAQLTLEGPATKTFPTGELRGAVAHLGLSDAQLVDVRKTALKLADDVVRCQAVRAAFAA